MSSAEVRRDAIIQAWKAHSDSLHLTDDQEMKIKAWFMQVWDSVQHRRAEVKGKIAELDKAGNESAKAACLHSIRQSFRDAAANRENFLNEFETILNPNQRASIVLYVAKGVEHKRKDIDRLLDHLTGVED